MGAVDGAAEDVHTQRVKAKVLDSNERLDVNKCGINDDRRVGGSDCEHVRTGGQE